MPAPDFDLPQAVMDAAMSRLVGAPDYERRAVLRSLMAEHPGHRDGLQALCNALDGAGRVLARNFATAPEPMPHIEGFTVTEQLGEGAFGVVYRCQQGGPIPRQVAVKLLRPGAGDRSTLQRFDSERRFLARLNHPAIAQIFDAGLLADGRPWFVMEYVPGVPITRYCDQRKLPVEARLRLFARLCQGVHHAHEQGIVHRDLKPANILVVEVDGEAQPKIIDFGIARALQPAEPADVRTETGRVVGTPGYMSPEQAAGALDEIDARSDLFSLGVVLYELLTGELPWGRRPDSTDSEPPRPSLRVGSDQQGTTIAEQRGSQPRRLKARLRGDLDWIVLKALARERPQRYPTALELSAEIGRHLRGEPVQAGPPSWGYRLRKFARRRRAALYTAAAAALLLGLGLWLLGRYSAEAQTRGKDAESAVASLLARANDKRLLAAPGSDAVRRSLAQDALSFYDQFLRDRPGDAASREGRARTLWTLSQVHWLLGQYAEAERTAREATADGEALLATAPDHVTWRRITANARRNLGRALASLGQKDAARAAFQSAVDDLERCHGKDPAGTAALLVRALMELRSTLDPTVADGADLLRRASEIQEGLVRARPGDGDERDGLVIIDLQRVALAAGGGDLDGARALLARCETALGAGILPGTIVSVHAMAGQLCVMAGDPAGAVQGFDQAIAVSREEVAREPARATPLAQLCSLLISRGEQLHGDAQFDERVRTHREAVPLCETWVVRFPEDPRALRMYVSSVNRLNLDLFTRGRRSSLLTAERDARRARELLAGLRPTLPIHFRLRASTLGGFGLVADALGLDDAHAVWAETAAALDDWRAAGAIGPEAVAEYALYAVRIARQRIVRGDAASAEAMLAQVQGLLDTHRSTVLELADHATEAARLRALAAVHRGALETAAEAAQQELAHGDDWRTLTAAAEAMSVVWQAARQESAAATALWRDRTIELCGRAIDALSRLLPDDPDDLWVVVPLARTRVRLAQARRDRGDDVDAAALTRALDTLLAVRAEAHASEWDQALFLAGQALLQR